jgi:hypothetical protein
MKLTISLLVLLSSYNGVFSQIDTIPKNEKSEYKTANKLIVGWWCFESKICTTGADTIIETSTYGRGGENKRPHTFLEFKRNGELFVHAQNYPQLSRLKKNHSLPIQRHGE